MRYKISDALLNATAQRRKTDAQYTLHTHTHTHAAGQHRNKSIGIFAANGTASVCASLVGDAHSLHIYLTDNE